MIVFIPYKSNVPIYHWPFATLGLILTNIFAFIVQPHTLLELSQSHFWLLTYGEGFHPGEWVGSIFAHGDVFHLIGNMIFLGLYGWIVEGKIGWWKFLLLYFGIGITKSLIEQTLMLGYSGPSQGSLGAASVIYGLLAVAMMWAPMNHISCFFGFLIFLIPKGGVVEVQVWIFGILYLVWEVVLAMLDGWTMTSSVIHLLGAGSGVAFGLVALKQGWVDCDQEDIVSIVTGKDKSYTRLQAEKEAKQAEEKHAEKNRAVLEQAQQQVTTYLNSENSEAALKLQEKMIPLGGLELSKENLFRLINIFHKQKEWTRSVPLMAEYVQRFPVDSQRVRYSLGQILLMKENRPGQALAALEKISPGELPENLESQRQKLMRKAESLIYQDGVDLEVTEDW